LKALDLDVMTMIVAVADTGNISRAAEVVHRSQSAVSMQIKTLETALGKPLFVRKPRSVIPTQDGEVLLTYARRMLALRDEAWAAVVRPDVTGRVSIGVPDDYASSLLPPILKKFSATYPKVEIQVVGLPSVALAPMVKDGSVDLVCATRVKGLSGEFIRLEPMEWAAAPGADDIWRERPLPIAASRVRMRFAASSARRFPTGPRMKVQVCLACCRWPKPGWPLSRSHDARSRRTSRCWDVRTDCPRFPRSKWCWREARPRSGRLAIFWRRKFLPS
jgi:DNA-binding transcriptional LysR family regulator